MVNPAAIKAESLKSFLKLNIHQVSKTSIENASIEFQKLSNTDLKGIMEQFNQVFTSESSHNNTYSIQLSQNNSLKTKNVKILFKFIKNLFFNDTKLKHGLSSREY